MSAHPHRGHHDHHGHKHDRGAGGLLRYLTLLPHMWTRELARVMRPGGRVLLPEALAASLTASGFASAEGSRTRLADRPVKLVRATR